MANTFELDRCRFHFRAVDPVRFPPGKAGNLFRGAFGAILREVACERDCPGAATCGRRAHCAYARLFEPAPSTPGPSGFANLPRPFVFRCSHLNGSVIQPGVEFFVDVHTFDTRFNAQPWFEKVFETLVQNGLGPGRSRVALTQGANLGHLQVSLESAAEPITQISIRFITPTELKAGGEVRNEPNFADLFARVRDRISSLSAFYGQERLDADFVAMAGRARSIRTERVSLQHSEAARRSSRTGQTHSIGGLTGGMDFTGDLGEFLPWLSCARWTGVGRHTVWGNGELHVIRAV